MNTITITMNGDAFSFTLTPSNTILFKVPNEDPVEFNPFEDVEDVDEMRDQFLEEGDSDEVANVRTWLWYNAPYLEYADEAPITALLDQPVLHLLGFLPVPLGGDLQLNIEDYVISRGDRRVSLPTTGTECFKPDEVYSELVTV